MVKIFKGLKFKIIDMNEVYEIHSIKNNSVLITYKGAPGPISISLFDINKAFKTGKYIPVLNQDGMFCLKCKNFSPMATANQPNNKFKCFKCRLGY